MGALWEAGLGAAEHPWFSRTYLPLFSKTMRTSDSSRCLDGNVGRWPLRLFSCTWRCPLEPSGGPRSIVGLCVS